MRLGFTVLIVLIGGCATLTDVKFKKITDYKVERVLTS